MGITGEITLNGKILQVSGIREKVLAAQRAGLSRVILPAPNAVDVGTLPQDLINNIEIVFADDVSKLEDLMLGKAE